MFDFGLSEMIMVGVVALVVLGPERLPVVARTAGEWVGKAQRYVSKVKYDIEKETELSELRKIQSDTRTLMNDVRASVRNSVTRLDKEVSDTFDDLDAEVRKPFLCSIEDARKEADSNVADFYGWNNGADDEMPLSECRTSGDEPTTEELAEEIASLRRELGLRARHAGGRRRLGIRSRVNKPRIYR